MASKLIKDSLQAALAHHRALVALVGAPRASSKLTGDNSKIALDSQPLIIKWGKKRVSDDVVDLEVTS